MWRKGTPHLGDRYLRFGAEGPDVDELQRRLAAFGYDVGRSDGRFGYWTEEALREFQRDHHVRVDGIAGRQVFEAMEHLSGVGATRRKIHVVREGETLRKIAARYGVHPAALRDANRMYGRRPLHPGRRLRVTSRLVWGWMSIGRDQKRQMRALVKHDERLTGVFVDGAAAEATGQVTPDAFATEPWHACGRRGLAGLVEIDVSGMSLPRRRKAMDDRVKRLVDWVRQSPARGCVIHLNRPRRGEGRRLARFVGRFSERLVSGAPGGGSGRSRTMEAMGSRARGERAARELRSGYPLYLSLPPPPVSRLGAWREGLEGLDWATLTQRADAVVLRTHLAERVGRRVRAAAPAGYARVSELLRRLIEDVPPWKIVLSVPVCAYDFTLDRPGSPWAVEPPRMLSYQTAITRARLERAELVWDEDVRAFRYEYVSDDRPHRIWVENRTSFAAKLDLVNRLELGGVAVWRLGTEDPRIWEVVPRKFGTSRFS